MPDTSPSLACFDLSYRKHTKPALFRECVGLQIGIQVFFQVFALLFLKSQSFYVPYSRKSSGTAVSLHARGLLDNSLKSLLVLHCGEASLRVRVPVHLYTAHDVLLKNWTS